MPLFEEENITQTLYRKQRNEAIQKALTLLPPQKRRICQMKIFEGLSNAEIAEQLNITVNTVKVSYYKAILSLRESLNEKDFICICMVLLLSLIHIFFLLLQATQIFPHFISDAKVEIISD